MIDGQNNALKLKRFKYRFIIQANIDYYKEGMIAAKKDFAESKRLYGLIWNQSLLNPMINHDTVARNPKHGKIFEYGYRKEVR